MPRYFFNIRNHLNENIVDEEGVELPDLETAKTEAHLDVIDLMDSRSSALDNRWPEWSIDVCDGDGNLLAVIPFSSN